MPESSDSSSPPPPPGQQPPPGYSWPPSEGAAPPGAGVAPPAEADQRRRSRRNIVIAAGVVVALAVAGGVAAVLLTGGSGHVGFPETIAGQPRVTSKALEGLANGVAEQASFGSEKPKVAFYGPETSPQFLIMAYDFAVEDSADTAFQGAINGIEGTTGGNAKFGAPVSASEGSTDYRCAPIDTQAFSGVFCLWVDDDTTGIVLTLTHPSSPIDLVTQVHDAVVA